MALAPGEVNSGGFVRDKDGALVAVAEGDNKSGGFLRDQDGRLVIGGTPDWADGDRHFVYMSQNAAAQKMEINIGTSAAPDEELKPMVALSKTHAIKEAGSHGDAEGELATFRASSIAKSTAQMPALAGAFGATTYSSYENGANALADALAVTAVGNSKEGSRTGCGLFVNGRRETTAGRTCAIELVSDNQTAEEEVYDGSTYPHTKGLHLHAVGKQSAVGLFTSNVGCGYHTWIGAQKGAPITDTILREDTTAKRGIFLNGERGTATGEGALVVGKNAGAVIIGAESSSFPGSAGTKLVVISEKTESATPLLLGHTGAVGTAAQVQNNKGTVRLFAVGAAGGFFTGTLEGEAGVICDSTKRVHLGRSGARAMLRVGDSLGIGPSATDSFGGGVGVVFLANAGTAPTTNPTGGGILYASEGKLFWRGSSGTVKELATA
jgi:hypothetical protein